MPFLSREPGRLVRRHMDNSQLAVSDAGVNPLVSEMIETLDGRGRPYILEKMAARYAQEIQLGTHPLSGEANQRFSVRTNEAKRKAIQAGLLEVSSLYLYQRIVRERATLWTEGQIYTYGDAADGFADDLQEARAEAGDSLAMARVDSLSVGCGSAAVLIQVLGSRLNYQPIRRDSIWVAFAPSITDDEIERPVDTLRLDDATCVVVRLGASDDGDTSRFAAWFGRSEVYPNGRFVQYATDDWSDIPDVWSDGVLSEYWLDNEQAVVANPLTVYADDHTGGAGPEYPIVTWLCDTSGYGGSLLPVQTDLYQQSKEFDLGASRVLLSALKSARGAFVLTKETGASSIVADVLDEGVVELNHGQGLQTMGHPASNSRDALGVIMEQYALTASAYNVPAYRVAVSESLQVPSGVALEIINEPLMRDRRARIELNRKNTARKFSIERALASLENGVPYPADIVEHWEPNELQLPVDPSIQADAWQKQIALGITDVVDVAREFAGLESREQAENYLETLRKQETAQQQPVASGLARFRAPTNA